MSRVIKVRAWDTKHKRWAGNVEFGEGASIGLYELLESCDKFRNVVWVQFTGLLDKHGKEIWEGDVVKWGHIVGGEEHPPRIAEVKMCPDIEFHSQVGVFRFGSFIYTDTEKWLEILGNIYEHPHLLEAR